MRQNKSSENRSQDVNPLKEIDFVVGGRRCAPKISHSDILKSTGGRVTVPHCFPHLILGTKAVPWENQLTRN